MLPIAIEQGRVRIGDRFSVSFQRTLRIPDDGNMYPLPPGLGPLPIQDVTKYAGRVPASWLGRDVHLFIPMYQREALWLGFGGAWWKPNAVKIEVGTVNAVLGEVGNAALRASPQNYLVCPNQPWLDGFKTGEAVIRQFVAMPLGSGYSVEGHVTGREQYGGIQMTVYEPKPGLFPDHPPPEREPQARKAFVAPTNMPSMGLGAGGRMRQKVYPDPYGIDTWDQEDSGSVSIHILNSEQYRQVTGHEPHPTPVDTTTYIQHGLPWFDLYDESEGDVPASEQLAGIKTIREVDEEKGVSSDEGNTSVEQDLLKIERLRHRKPTRDE